MLAITCAHALSNVSTDHHTALELGRHALSGTVGFVTVSGLLVGWFATSKRDHYDRIVRRYVKQALRFLLIVHPLIALELAGPEGVTFGTFVTRTVLITDALALLFVTLVPLLPRISARARLVVGLALVLANPFVDLWHGGLISELLTGIDPTRDHVMHATYGLVPVTGMFLVGTWLGARFAETEDEQAFSAFLLRGAAWLIALTALFIAAWRVASAAGLPEVARFFYPDYETTLYPGYLGEAFILIALASRLPQLRALTVIGKTSLFAYVVQYALVQTLPYYLGWKGAVSPWAWPVMCLVAGGLLVAAGAAWNRYVKHA